MDLQKQSGFGIASFITSIFSGIFIFLILIIAGVMETSTPGGLDEESVEAVVIGLFLFFFIGTSIIALGLGIAGLIQKGRKRVFAVLGTIFSSVALVGTIIIFLIGLSMS